MGREGRGGVGRGGVGTLRFCPPLPQLPGYATAPTRKTSVYIRTLGIGDVIPGMTQRPGRRAGPGRAGPGRG